VIAARVVVALEPRSHREALRDAIAQLRPLLDLVAIAPGDLGARPGRYVSAVVLLNHPLPAVQDRAFAWVVILPTPGARALVSIGGERWAIEQLELPGLLSLIDFSVTAFRIARARRPYAILERQRGGMLAALRSTASLLATWRYAQLLVVATVLPLGYALSCPCKSDSTHVWHGATLMLTIAALAALEIRQLRHRGRYAWGNDPSLPATDDTVAGGSGR
jgi:hypothetical protein